MPHCAGEVTALGANWLTFGMHCCVDVDMAALCLMPGSNFTAWKERKKRDGEREKEKKMIGLKLGKRTEERKKKIEEGEGQKERKKEIKKEQTNAQESTDEQNKEEIAGKKMDRDR